MHSVSRSSMHFMRPLRLGATSAACTLVLFAADFWKTKDASQWTSEEINKILSDSPWARGKTVQPEQSQMRRGGGGGGRRGGFGGGFPGGGGGFPGGGGGGYPGGNGGGGYPGGSNGGDGSQAGPMNLTIRWDSALPVQQALMRQSSSESDELKAATAATEKYYVVSVLGLRMPRPRSRSNDSDDQTSDSTSNNNDGQRRNQNDALRSQLLDAAQLAPKGKSSIYAQDVQIDGPGGIDGVRFLFPRTNPISAGDKEVDFILNIRRIKVEEKFKLNDMQYEGKLAL